MWVMAEQYERDNPVLCKNIRMRPQDDTFVPIGFPLYQVIMERNNSQFKLKWQKHRGFPKFVVVYPQLNEFTKPERDDFVTLKSFHQWCIERFGKDTGNNIVAVFATRIPEILNMI